MSDMTAHMVLEKIILLIEEMLTINKKSYTQTPLSDATIVDLPLDSFDMLQLVFKLEEALGIRIETDLLYEEKTLAGLAQRLAGMRQ